MVKKALYLYQQTSTITNGDEHDKRNNDKD
jgi:hypothetical protein